MGRLRLMAALGRSLACALAWSAANSLALAGPLTAVVSNAANIEVKLEPIVTLSGLVPIDSATIPGDGRLYVGTYIASSASVQIVDPATKTVSPTPFLTFAGTGVPISGQGLQGITFSPNFNDDTKPGYRRFYTYQMETGPGAGNVMFPHPEVQAPNQIGTVREWTANVEGTAIDTSIPARLVFSYGGRSTNGHLGGGIKFGPDGYLYISTGDSGGGGEGFSGSLNSTNDGFTGRNDVGSSTYVPAISNGQDFTNPLGKVLRIDPYVVNGDGSPRATPEGAIAQTFLGAARYFIPGDNPFVGNPQNIYFTPIGPVDSQVPVAPLGELFAVGFRNPWKLSFDKNAAAGDAPYVADVGSHQREEINVVERGKNYGWPYREGDVESATAASRPLVSGNVPYVKQTSPGVYTQYDLDPTFSDPTQMALPLVRLGTQSISGGQFWDRPGQDYFNDGIYGDEWGDTSSATGGFVYRGTSIPILEGMYVFGGYESLIRANTTNYVPQSVGGRLFYFDPNEVGAYKTVREFNFLPGFGIAANAGGNILSIAEGDDGELYVMFANGDISRIAAPPLPGDYNNDHVVDAADYTVWRDHLGSTDELPNDEIGGEIGAAQYNQWKENFGTGAGGAGGVAAVPEPATAFLVVMVLACVGRMRLRSRVGATLLALAAGLWAQADASAASYYWDTNGATPGIGSAGGAAANWHSNSWATGSAGNLPTGTWPNTQAANSDEAVFQGTAGTVSIAADVYANALRFQTNNYTINSTGGTLHLVGANPKITVNLSSSNQVVTLSAPLAGDNGLTLAGNGLSGGLKFLVLANANLATPNSYAGPLAIEAGGALRLGGGVAAEQIPDDVDLQLAGVIDFITSGGTSDGKQEKVRNVSVSGANAIFSVGNGSNFIVNSIAGSGTQNISINGNAASVPGKLSITGWADGAGNLTLADSAARVNTTSASFAIGGRILLAGNLLSSGTSAVINHNGGPTTPEDHVFTNKALDFTSAAHTIDVAGGTLTFTSRAAIQPLDITSTFPGGTTLTKTGSGVLLYEHAVQSSFTGVNRVAAGTLRLGANERLANESTLEVAGGVFDMQGFVERVGAAILDGGSIIGAGAARLIATQFDVRSGSVGIRLDGLAGLAKSTDGLVELLAANSYTGDTSISAGTLRLHAASLADAADVRLAAGATLDLSFAGTDVVDSLFVDGVSQVAGTWGAPTSTADHKSPLFAGDGLLQVTTFVAPPITGDFNNDSMVDAADYTTWRDALGSSTTLPNDQTPDMVTVEDYDDWKSHFGAAGSGASFHSAAPLPEISGGASAIVALSLCVAANRERKLRISSCLVGEITI